MAIAAPNPVVKSHNRLAVALVAFVLLMVGFLLAAAHVLGTHSKYGEWAWTPTSTPPKLQFDSFNYHRSTRPALPPDGSVVARGQIAGGSTVFATTKSKGPAEVYVRRGSDLVEYFRIGGGG